MKLLEVLSLFNILVFIINKKNDLQSNLGYLQSYQYNQPFNFFNYYQNTNPLNNPNILSSVQQPYLQNSSEMNNFNSNLNTISLLLRDPFINQYLNFMSHSSQIMSQQSKNNSTKNDSKVIPNLNIKKPLHKSKIKSDELASSSCDSSDIYCLCKFHPRYKDCVCLAYPKSVICSETYCAENPKTYECNPLRCDKKPNDNNCFCKENIDDIKCKCKLNPVNKECFCMKFPFSHLCNERICKFNPNSLFCKCDLVQNDKICSPKYCFKNPNNPQCECIINPLNGHCKCLNDPNSCEKNKMMRDVVEYDIRIRNLCNHNSTFVKGNKNINSTIINVYYPNLNQENKSPAKNCSSPVNNNTNRNKKDHSKHRGKSKIGKDLKVNKEKIKSNKDLKGKKQNLRKKLELNEPNDETM